MRFILVLLLTCAPILATPTHLLTGTGYTPGLSYVTRLSIEAAYVVPQGTQKVSHVFVTAVSVLAVDKDSGKVLEAVVELSGDYDKTHEGSRIPAAYMNTPLHFRRGEAGWQVSLKDQAIPSEDHERLRRITFCEESRPLPDASVPVGHRWTQSIPQFLHSMGAAGKEFTEMIRSTSGQATYRFKGVATTGDQATATITTEVRGRMDLPGVGTLQAKGTFSEARRLDCGLLTQSSGHLMIKGAGAETRMTLQTTCTITLPTPTQP